MLRQHLQQHQWKAFRRNPMFERNLGVRIFMFIVFGFLALELLAFGFFLDTFLLETGTYERTIDTFNSVLLYIFVFDFAIKFLFKGNQSMQIAPYLTLPIKQNRLFDFLLIKEFKSFWNLYFLFLVVPFAFKSITPFFGLGTAFSYILFFYLLCVAVSLLVNIINNLINLNFWFYVLPLVIVAAPFVLPFIMKIDWGQSTQEFGEQILNHGLWVWLELIFFLLVLWMFNRMQMREVVYRELQGEKTDKISSFSSLSFLDQLGGMGDFMNLEIRMILRSKRLKSQLYVVVFLLLYFFWQMYDKHSVFQESYFSLIFFGMFTIGSLGLVMGQYIFTSESSFFDGLMARKLSIQDMLKSKYLLYFSYSLLITLLLLICVFQGKISLLFLSSIFFYVVGPVFFMIFQNAVYNKTYFDLFDGGMMNWKGTSSNMLIVTMITMFLPILLVVIINAIFGNTVSCWFMLGTGILFTLSCKYWLKWTYKRFLKRKYKNMEGFRSNA